MIAVWRSSVTRAEAVTYAQKANCRFTDRGRRDVAPLRQSMSRGRSARGPGAPFQLLPPLDPFSDRFFVTGVGGLVPPGSPQRFRQVLLRRICLVVVVGVLVTLAVSQILHQTGRRIANVERDWLGRMLLGSGLRVSERGVRAVRLRRGGEIDGGLREGQL